MYVDPDVPEQRVVEAAALLPVAGAVTGWGALRLHGATFFDGLAADGATRLPVQLVAGPHHGRRAADGVRWLQDRLDPEDVVVRAGVRVTVPERATFDVMRTAHDVRAATVGLDMAVAAELTSIARMGRFIGRHPGWVGAPQARAGLRLGSEHSRSPQETGLHLVWRLDARLPPPLLNRAVFSRRTGRMLGVADLLDVEAGLVVEFDGADHAGAARRSRDAGREGGLRDHGLEVERVSGYDMHRVPTLVRRLHAARRRARWEPHERRRWTIEPPRGWDAALPLDARLDLQDFERGCDERWFAEGAGR
jgi:very-short-patch-repair endonuclease